jgi:hypothetical protein
MPALVIVVCPKAITTFGSQANNTFRTAGARLKAAAS